MAGGALQHLETVLDLLEAEQREETISTGDEMASRYGRTLAHEFFALANLRFEHRRPAVCTGSYRRRPFASLRGTRR
jgi:hypothetical protein